MYNRPRLDTNVCACFFAGKADTEPKGSDAKITPTKKAMEEKGLVESRPRQVKLESKYLPALSKKRKDAPKDFVVVTDPPTSLRSTWTEDDDEDYWGDPQPMEHEIPTWPDDLDDEKPIMADDDGTFQMLESDSLEMKVLRESARASLIKNYVWADSTKNFVDVPQSFQDAVPMKKRERKELLKDVPDNFGRVFPCRGTRSLTKEDRKRVKWWNELWFLEKGAPKLHGYMVDELRALLYLAQECGDAPERVGLQLDELQSLLQKIIKLHVDTMRMLASMQTKRAILATNRGSDENEADPQTLIISDKRREREVKRAESSLAADIVSRPLLRYSGKKPSPFGGLGTRRPRQSYQGFTPRGSAPRTNSSRGYFSKRGRGRGRAYQGGAGRGQPSQL